MASAKKLKPTKDSEQPGMFSFLVDKELKDAFVNSCTAMDTTASREIRAFMRQYIAKNGQQRLI